jgi:hypothetical protein
MAKITRPEPLHQPAVKVLSVSIARQFITVPCRQGGGLLLVMPGEIAFADGTTQVCENLQGLALGVKRFPDAPTNAC